MSTTITVKGQVTIPKNVRDAMGVKPGDAVEIRATASGGAFIEKAEAKKDDYKARLYALSKMGLVRDRKSTDAIMKELRGDPDEDPGFNPKLRSK